MCAGMQYIDKALESKVYLKKSIEYLNRNNESRVHHYNSTKMCESLEIKKKFDHKE